MFLEDLSGIINYKDLMEMSYPIYCDYKNFRAKLNKEKKEYIEKSIDRNKNEQKRQENKIKNEIKKLKNKK